MRFVILFSLSIRFDLNLNLFYSILMSNECWFGLVWFDDEQLFESQSVIEYWENFASHAFENTTQSVFSHCVLLKPGGEPIPCTFCFSIRRDIFDMPSVVIGEFFSVGF